jgi:hypothetical protein
MSELFSSVEFWFGAVAVSAFQVERFGVLSADDSALSIRRAVIPNLRAHDFASRFTFRASLLAFLVVSFAMYALFCLVSPTVFQGWAQVSGSANPEELKTFVESVPYPLYIAAAFMGLTQPAIPILSRIGDMQRDLFHSLMGVPKRVVATSDFFANQIFARSPDREAIAREVTELTGDSWLERIDSYADSMFYRDQVRRMKLDEEAELNERLAGSKRELRDLAGQLVYASALAAVRESGVKSLGRLAADLRVEIPAGRATMGDIFAVIVLLLVGTTMLWCVLPLFDSLATRFLTASPTFDFWPNTLSNSGQYLMVQVAPMLAAVTVGLATWCRMLKRSGPRKMATGGMMGQLSSYLERYAAIITVVVAVLVGYDLLQAFFDYGYFSNKTPGSFQAFVVKNLPFFLLHSFISAAACFLILLHVDNIAAGVRKPLLPSLGLLVSVVGGLALFYAAARLYYQFKFTQVAGLDYVVLVVVLNLAAALLSFIAASFCCRAREPEARDDRMAIEGTTASNVRSTALPPAAPQLAGLASATASDPAAAIAPAPRRKPGERRVRRARAAAAATRTSPVRGAPKRAAGATATQKPASRKRAKESASG